MRGTQQSLARWLFFANQGKFRGGRLRADHEQGELPEPDLERGFGVVPDPDPEDRRGVASFRAAGHDGDLARVAAANSRDPQREL